MQYVLFSMVRKIDQEFGEQMQRWADGCYKIYNITAMRLIKKQYIGWNSPDTGFNMYNGWKCSVNYYFINGW